MVYELHVDYNYGNNLIQENLAWKVTKIFNENLASNTAEFLTSI